jgi:hypothetical protein
MHYSPSSSQPTTVVDLGGRSSITPSMVHSLPLHDEIRNQPRLGMKLPTPSSFAKAARRPRPTLDMHEYDDPSYHASSRSNSQFLSPALWGIFWEPHVDCSPVSAWLLPIIQLVQTPVKSGNVEVLGHVFTYQCPSIAPLPTFHHDTHEIKNGIQHKSNKLILSILLHLNAYHNA